MPSVLTINACPNCASRELEINVDAPGEGGARLRCNDCWLRGPDAKTVVEAVEVWNRMRVDDAQKP